MTRVVGFRAPDPKIREVPEWTDLVIDIAHHFGWLVSHKRPARTNKGYRTAISGNAGFPDIAASHPMWGTVFAELKSHRGKLSPAQEAWRQSLVAGGARYFLWKPADFGDVLNVFSGKALCA
jgi:hypothetical protein